MPKYKVGILRTVTATREFEVEADNSEDASEKAVEEAANTDWHGSITEYDHDVCAGPTLIEGDEDEAVPSPGTDCPVCGKKMPAAMNEVADEGWYPGAWDGEKQIEDAVCGTCIEKYFVENEGEHELKPLKGEFVSVWDGGVELRSPCTVNVYTRMVVVGESDKHGADDRETLDDEYVLLDGVKYHAEPSYLRSVFSADEQRKMFFYD